jgi:Raf kinase inhibitor-like YbhB/YbcL family protein
MLRMLIISLLVFVIAACGGAGGDRPAGELADAEVGSPVILPTAEAPEPPTAVTISPTGIVESGFLLTSAAFVHNGTMQAEYTCRDSAAGGSPPLAWTTPPAGTVSLALLMDDPDAGSTPYVHWIIYNIPADTELLPAGVPEGAELDDGIRQGMNSRGTNAYFGPCPPSGTHRYMFTLFALDTTLVAEEGRDKNTLLASMAGHILAETTLTGLFGE